MWQNRVEPNIIKPLIAAITAGIVIPLLTIFTVLNPEKSKTRVPTTFFYYPNLQRSIPLQDYYKSNTNLRYIDSIDVPPPIVDPSIYRQAEQAILMSDYDRIPTRGNPIETEENIFSDSIQDRYFRMFITGAIWDMCNLFSNSWDIEKLENTFPTSDRTTVTNYDDLSKKFIPWEDLLSKLNATEIFKDNPLQRENIPGLTQGINLPPNSEIKFVQQSFYFSIIINNPFSSIDIKFQKATYSRGFGRVGRILAIRERDDIVNASYIIEINSELKRWKIGHPNMSKYRRWVSNIEEQFNQLNIEETQEELKEWRSFKQ